MSNPIFFSWSNSYLYNVQSPKNHPLISCGFPGHFWWPSILIRDVNSWVPKKNRVPDFQTNPYYEPIKTQLFGGFKKIPKQ
jgi:hypothetical protein